MPAAKKELRIKNKELRVKKETKTRDTRKSRGTLLSVPVYSLTGRTAGTLSLPKEVFGQKVNEKLLTQALRVYMTNQKTLPGSTKTRGEVRGSTAKIYRQKGTGRARHGAIRAPIFIGGGIAFGPKPRKVRLDLPKKMKKTALVSALSEKMGNKEILGISGTEKATGKTKQMVQLFKKVGTRNALIVTGEKSDNVVRAVRNIPGSNVLPANLINAYEVLKHDKLLITKEAISVILGTSEARTPESRSKDSGQARMTKGSKR